MLSGKNNQDRKNKITEILLKDEVENAIKLLKPFYKESIIEYFDLNDDFIFNIVENLEKEINLFLEKEINYENDINDLMIILEKSYYIEIFLTKTVMAIKALCKKISTDLKQINLQNIE